MGTITTPSLTTLCVMLFVIIESNAKCLVRLKEQQGIPMKQNVLCFTKKSEFELSNSIGNAFTEG
jgi:hypothetical protein